MQKVKFVTEEQDKIVVWCETNSIIVFRDFMQYILDNMNEPEKFMIIDTSNDLVYGAYCIATKQYEMRKRTFEERMNNVQTGKWARYSDTELKEMTRRMEMITRNCLGEIEPRIGKYFIKRTIKGKYEIMKNEPWYITNAVIADEVLMWSGTEPFDSIVKAYAWLKKYVNELL